MHWRKFRKEGRGREEGGGGRKKGGGIKKSRRSNWNKERGGRRREEGGGNEEGGRSKKSGVRRRKEGGGKRKEGGGRRVVFVRNVPFVVVVVSKRSWFQVQTTSRFVSLAVKYKLQWSFARFVRSRG